ncbi:MAG: hypothetical protein MZV64_11475 [Ignavibacteriales bacterium]|nr:hypothetical protein [Ignavibacteriales bacterium]MCK7518289.1 hypothetical protein [Ignavibacteriales bacterium]
MVRQDRHREDHRPDGPVQHRHVLLLPVELRRGPEVQPAGRRDQARFDRRALPDGAHLPEPGQQGRGHRRDSSDISDWTPTQSGPARSGAS